MKNKTEQQDREEILAKVKDYYEKYHIKKSYIPGDRIGYAGRVYDNEEMENLVDSALDFWLTSGKYVDRFEKDFASFLGIKYCALVNSGSSANLIAFMTLTSPLLKDRAIKRGDEIITVAAGFPTTIASIVQYGAIPVFVDMTIPQYNIDVTQLESALSDKTKAVMIAHTLGNVFDITAVKNFCEKHNLWLIEDNCDALGSRYTYNRKEQYTGTFGDIGTSSFYPPHHMTMGEGGAVYTNDPLLNRIIRSMRDWGRDCMCGSGQDNLCGHRFDKQYGELPQGYDHKYVYSHLGYNLKATEMQAAVGCAQLKKLSSFIAKRRENFDYLYNNLKKLDYALLLPEPCENSKPSWFGFIMTCKDGYQRNAIVKYLEDNGIQTRMLFGGNMVKQPCFLSLSKGKDYKIIGDLETTDTIMNRSFWIGLYPGMEKSMLDYMIEKLKEAVEGQKK